MSIVENGARYLNLARSVSAGIRSPAGSDVHELVDDKVEISEFTKFNPSAEQMLGVFCETLWRRKARVSGLKEKFGVSRAKYLELFSSFTDHHCLPIDIFLPHVPTANKYIDEIYEKIKKNRAPVNVLDQLEKALDLTDNDLTEAAIVLFLSSRTLARNWDTRLMGRNLFPEDLKNWKKWFCPFAYNSGEEDTSGDTYHFWAAFLGGISREENFDKRIANILKQFACDLIFPNTARVTELLRHRLFLKMPKNDRGERWNTHEYVDVLGYNVGRALYTNIVAQSY